LTSVGNVKQICLRLKACTTCKVHCNDESLVKRPAIKKKPILEACVEGQALERPVMKPRLLLGSPEMNEEVNGKKKEETSDRRGY
jgi:hypothetical protein